MKKIIAIASLTLAVGGAFAQTGIFYFGDSTDGMANHRIISVREGKGGELYLLGKSRDVSYKSTHPYWVVADSKGKILLHKTLEITNEVYELTNMAPCTSGKIQLWGTESKGGALGLFTKKIDRTGYSETEEAILGNTTTLCGDIQQVDTNTTVLVKTVKSSSTGLYHISVFESTFGGNQVWYKTLQKGQNEEASKTIVLKDKSVVVLAKLYDDQLSSYKTLIYKLTASGEIAWRKELDTYTSFYQQGIAEGKDGQLVYVSSINNGQAVQGDSKLVTLSASGDVLSTTEVKDMLSTGILSLRNGNILIYGSRYRANKITIVLKAKFILFDPNMKQLKEDEMGFMDAPDGVLPSLAMSTNPTTSEYITATQLADGRIVCAGRVYMPAETSPEKIIGSARIENALFVLMKMNGDFR